MKDVFKIITGLITLIALLELTCRMIAPQQSYRSQLRRLMAYSIAEPFPCVACDDIGWKENEIAIRVNDRIGETTEHHLGGTKIPDAFAKPRTSAVQPDYFSSIEGKRIFVVGGSAAFGYPFHSATHFGSLITKHSAGLFDVINAAQPGWCSGKLVPVFERIVNHFKPDLIVLFTGNNEWISWNHIPVPAKQKIRITVLKFCSNFEFSSRIVFNRMLATAPQPSHKQAHLSEFEPHKELIGDEYANQVAYLATGIRYENWQSDKRKALATYEENLSRMIAQAKKASVPVVLMNMPFRKKLSPAWKHPQLSADNDQSPLRAYAAAENAAIAGNQEQARQLFVQSRELMIGNLGSMLSVNERIAQVAESENCDLIDLRSAFARFAMAEGDFFNETLFADDCHPNIVGHQIIAEELYKYLESKEL